MSKKHGWSKEDASAARTNYNLNVDRNSLANEEPRKCKPRKYRRKICPVVFCSVQPKRLDNHLRQFHKLNPKKVKLYMKKAIVPLELETDDESEATLSSDSSSEGDEQENLERLYQRSMVTHHPFQEFDQNSDDSDDDWLGAAYMAGIGKPEEKIESKSYDESVSSESDSEGDYEDIEQRFIMTTLDEDKVLDKFKNWLVGIEGGRKPERTAQEHRTIVSSILRLKESGKPFQNMIDKDLIESWMNGNADRGLKPGTIRTNNYSILAFYEFCEMKEENLKTVDMQRMRVVIRKWNKNLKKAIEESGHEKALRDLNDLPPPEAIHCFDTSIIVAHAKELFKKINLIQPDSLLRRDFCAMRDFLMSSIILDNASRSGAISNMTMEEMEAKRKTDDGYLIAVKKHKTGYKGPALLSIRFSLFTQLQLYVSHLRNALPGLPETGPKHPVFVSWAGNKMASGMVLGQFCSFWRQAVPTKYHRINTGLVRKFATTTVRSNIPDYKKQTADLLCHSDRTAERDYTLIDKTKKASQSSRIIRRAIRTNFDNISDVDEMKSVKESMDSIVEEDDGEISTERASRYVPSGRIKYSEEDIHSIHKHFKELITSKRNITMSEVEATIAKEKEIKEISDRVGKKSVLIKIRTERSKLS